MEDNKCEQGSGTKSETYKKDDKRERQRNWDGEIRIKIWKGKTIRANEQCGLFIIWILINVQQLKG